MNDCPSCGAVMDCSDPLVSYSIQSPLFPIVSVCPPGRDCTLGLGFHLVCCSQDIAIDFPAGFDQAQKQQIVNNAIAECQRQAQFCVVPPPSCPNPPCVIKVFWNDAQTCSAKCPDGSEFSYTVGAGVYLGTDLAIVNNLAYKQACNLAKDHKICLSALAGPYCAGSAQSFEIKATGKYLAVSPFSDYWAVSGNIPTGMTFHGGFRTDGKCVIDGTPTTAGTYTFTVTVTEQMPGPSFGDYTSRIYTLKVVQITNADPLPDGSVGNDYSVELTVSPVHDATTETWTITSGSLPAGIALDPDGTLSGIPTGMGTSSFTAQVQFTLDGKSVTCSKDFSIEVTDDVITPSITSSAQSCFVQTDAGTYAIEYVAGALNYANNVNLWNVNNILATGYYIKYNGGGVAEDYFSELTTGAFTTQALAEAANANKIHIIAHTGGSICMYLKDSPYGDNHPGAPNPTFRLTKIA